MGSEQLLPDAHREGAALCLSGGGFRATLFHLGAIQRLNELGALSQIDTFVSVSGGSILNGLLAARWNDLRAEDGVFTNLVEAVVEPARRFCSRDLRTQVLLWDRVNPLNWRKLAGDTGSVTDLLRAAYAEIPGFGKSLGDLRPAARFLFCACNLETGANWEFELGPERARMGDYRVGYRRPGAVTLAHAVAASSAFPLTFPPLVLGFDDPERFEGGQGGIPEDMAREIPLTDGGVYDNLGLEPVWKTSRLLLASDAGSPFALRDNPGNGLVDRLRRSHDIIASQSGGVRKRWLVGNFKKAVLIGTYWGIATDFEDYPCRGPQGYPAPLRDMIRGIRTDLDAFTPGEIGCLENHGYSLADAAVRGWLADELTPRPAPFRWPSPDFAPERPGAVTDALADSGERGIASDLWRSVLEQARGWFDERSDGGS